MSYLTDSKRLLPQLGNDVFLSSCGIATTMLFLEGYQFPDFGVFNLLMQEDSFQALLSLYRKHATIAAEFGFGLVLDTPTWRVNADWLRKIGYSHEDLPGIIQRAVDMVKTIKQEFPQVPIVIGGRVGTRGDGYSLMKKMTPEEAFEYHRCEIEAFAAAGADLISSVTMTYPEEVIGIVEAAREAGMPITVSFTIETDGRTPSGHLLPEAIAEVDAATNAYPVYYMVDCAHPSHFDPEGSPRVRGVLANASRKSHAELDGCTELDSGDPVELASELVNLRQRFPGLSVLGGCCGTDPRHIHELAKQLRLSYPKLT